MDVLTKSGSSRLGLLTRILLALVICRMVNLSLEHGNSDGSCFAYVVRLAEGLMSRNAVHISGTTRPDSSSAGSVTIWSRNADCVASRRVRTWLSEIL